MQTNYYLNLQWNSKRSQLLMFQLTEIPTAKINKYFHCAVAVKSVTTEKNTSSVLLTD